MGIALRGTPQSVDTIGPTATVNAPAGIVKYDYIEITINVSGNLTNPPTILVPDGFIPVPNSLVVNAFGGGTHNVKQQKFYRIADGTEGASFAIAHAGDHGDSNIGGACVVYSGVNPRRPFHITPTVTSNPNSADPTTADLGNTKVPGAWHILTFSSWGAMSGAISGYTEDLDFAGSTVEIWHKEITPAGATGAQLQTMSTDGWTAVTHVLNPDNPSETIKARKRKSVAQSPFSWTITDRYNLVYYFFPAPPVAGAIQVTSTDAGAGSEAHSVTATVPASDSGAGTETTATTAATTASDSGSGTEIHSVTAAVPSSESGSGTEAHSVTATVGSAENGSGSESHSTLAVVGLSDSGAGTETTNVSIPQESVDSGAGSESTVVTAAVTVTDSGAGTEAHNVTAVVGATDSGSGSESSSTNNFQDAADTATGSEAHSVTAAVPNSESGSGSEAHSVTATVGPAENGSGSEATSTVAIVGLSDSASGTETTTTSGSVPAADSGVGSESVTVSTPGTPATPTADDSGVGSESTSITVTGVIGPPLFHEGQIYPRVRHELPLLPPRFIEVFDGGIGEDQHFVTASVVVFDSGLAADSVQPSAVNAADSATGRDYPSVEKFEDEDSERRTLIFLAGQGAITLEELAILLMGKEP